MVTPTLGLQPGAPAPDLSVSTPNGVFRMAAYYGRQHILLYFMRSFDCPVCMGHVARLHRLAAQLEAEHITVIVFGPGDQHEAERLRSRLSLSFIVIADPERSAYLQYGLDKGLGGIQCSGSFLIDHAGIVRYAVRSTLPTGALKEPLLLAAINQLAPAANTRQEATA